jgi:hypothetical protein
VLGVDVDRVRTEITMEQVLSLLRLQPPNLSSVQSYGSCPLHESTSRRARSGSVNVAIGRYSCHRLENHGHQLDLWAAARRPPPHQAAIDLCGQLGRDVPWIRLW